MPFEEILGQERPVQVIRNVLAAGNLPHAYLFYGARGVGRFKMASALAKALFCKEQEADFCGTCMDCRQVEKGGHQDFNVVFPLSKKNEKEWEIDFDKGEIRIDQIRALQRWISVRSFEGGWRVCVFDGAEKINPQAANALLKTLEEPPPKSLLILISPTRTHLLPTIQSRCHAIYFSPLQGRELEEILADRLDGSQEDLSLIAALSEGSVGRALCMDRDWVLYERREWMNRLIALLARDPSPSILGFADELSKSEPERLTDILDLYLSWYRDLMIFHATAAPERLLNRDFLQEIREASAEGESSLWPGCIRAIQNAKTDIQNRINAQLTLETLLFMLAGGRKGPVKALPYAC